MHQRADGAPSAATLTVHSILVSCAAKAGIRNPKTRISIEALRVTGSPRKRGKTRGGGRYVIAGLVWAMSIRKAQRADYRDGREQGATMTK